MEYVPKPKHKDFYGRVLDGPFEGEWIECEDSYFVGQFSRLLYAVYTGWPAGVEIDRALYKWLPSYRAWVWMQ